MLMLKAFLPQFLVIIFCFPLPTPAAFPSLPSRPLRPPPLQGRSAGHSKPFECALVRKGNRVAEVQDGIAMLLYLTLKES